MRTSPPSLSLSRTIPLVCVFAHQDDEFAVYPLIEQAVAEGREVECVYLTDGQTHYASSARRNLESLLVLQRLGVSADRVHFVGERLGIQDGQLAQNLLKAAGWLHGWLDQRLPSSLESTYQANGNHTVWLVVPAWEGGHPDHDLIHALVCAWAVSRKCTEGVAQFALYNGWRCGGAWFRLMTPLPENGPISQVKVAPRQAIRYLTLALCYPSQWRSWLGLWPLFFFHHLRGRGQFLQPVNAERLVQPPHEGRLYYERRSHARWSDIRFVLEHQLSTLLRAHAG